MAKKKPDGTGDDDKPSNTTSGGEAPEPAGAEPATTEGAGPPKGAAHYPPSPSDSAGEKTDNIAPSRELPPDPPGADGADPVKVLEAQLVAMATALRSLGIDPAPICEGAVARAGGEKKLAGSKPIKRATVTPHVGSPVVVEYPADAKNPHAAAVVAYQEHTGQWSLPQQPHVEHHTDVKGYDADSVIKTEGGKAAPPPSGG